MSSHEEYGIPAIGAMGGGGGLSVIAQALRPHIRENLTAVVGVFDSGGGTGDIRTEYGGIAVGDLRNVCEAMSQLTPDTLKGLSGKFGQGKGGSDLNIQYQSPGNLFLANLLQHFPDDPERVVAAYSDLFQIEGKVLPITNESRELLLTEPGEGGETLFGEHNIDNTTIPNLKGWELTLDKETVISAEAAAALRGANLIVTGLGDLYTSVGPNVLVKGTTEILEETPVFFVLNLMNPPYQTRGFTAVDILEEFKRLNGDKQVVDRVIYNTKPLNKVALRVQMEKGSNPVEVDVDALRDLGYDVQGYELASDEPVERDPNDKVVNRAPIRHDTHRLGRAILREFYTNGFHPNGEK